MDTTVYTVNVTGNCPPKTSANQNLHVYYKFELKAFNEYQLPFQLTAYCLVVKDTKENTNYWLIKSINLSNPVKVYICGTRHYPYFLRHFEEFSFR